MTALLLCLLSPALAFDTGATTGDTGTPGTTPPGTTPPTGVTVDPIDTGPAYCASCSTAAELAGEEGGSPCKNGCATGSDGALPVAMLLLPLLAYRRSYST